MKRIMPSPLLSLALLAIWLLLNQSIELAHLLLGGALGILIPLWAQSLQPHGYARIRKPWVFIKLLFTAGLEATRSVYNVTQIILMTRLDGLNSQFIRIPLDMKSPHGLAFLAGILNMTPGTVWVEVLPDTGELVLHVFDLQDTQWWIDTIKHKYEQPLM
jgi:multicomponent K+:H+ antiporter subunit E